MTTSSDTLRTKLTVVEILAGKPGSANWTFLSERYGMGGFTVPDGAIQDFTEIDPVTLAFKKLTPGREVPDRIEFPVMTKMRKVIWVEKNLRSCQYQVRLRDVCGTASDPLDYERIMYLLGAYRVSREMSDPQASLEAQDQERTLTMTSSAAVYDVAYKVNGRRIDFDLGATYEDVDINDWIYCASEGCAECGCDSEDSDGCDLAFGVTDADSAPYANPYLIVYDDGVYSVRRISVFAGDALSVVCAGNKVLVASATDGGVAYATKDNDYDDWAAVTADFVNCVPLRLYAVDAANIWAACTGGGIYKSEDGGLSWVQKRAPNLLALTDLNAVWFANANLGYFGGDAGALIKYEDGDFSVLTDPTGGANILHIEVPPDRDCEVYLSTSAATMWASRNKGNAFTEYQWAGNNAGNVPRFSFAGYQGQMLWIVQNNAAGAGRILRDHSGGAGGTDVEQVTAYASATNGFNAIDACSINEAIGVGDIVGDMFGVRVS